MVKYFFKRAAMLMALAAVVIASGCKQTVNTETVNTGTTAVAVTGIKLNKGELSLKVGESKKLVATVMPANATNKQVTWASDKPAVATVSQDGTVTAKEEGTAQITVKTVNGGKIARCKITVTAKDPTPTAEFTVEVTHVEHGTISANPAIPASGKIAKDTSITFTAKADTGFSVDTWTITGGEILDGTGTEGSLTAKVKITANTKVNVTFKALSPGEFSVGMTADEHGTISADPDIIGGKAVKDSVITFTALPEKGYEVDKWSITTDSALIEGGTEGSLTAKVKITTNTTVTVSFKKISYKVTFDAKGGLPVPTAQHVLYKEKASVPTVPAKEGYDFEDWFNKDGDEPWVFTVNEVTKDTELYAKWKTKKYTVNFNVDGGNGDITGMLNGSSFTTGKEVEHGNTVEFSAKPKEGYKVDKWSITSDSTLIEGGTEGSLTAKVKITTNTTVTVTFKALSPGEFSVGMTADEHGTISADPDIIGGKAAKDSVITFTALPETGYEADKWSITPDFALIEGGTRLSKTAKVKITTNTTVTVSFKKKDYALRSNARWGGYITAKLNGKPLMSLNSVEYNSVVEFTADPEAGFIIDKWMISGGKFEKDTGMEGSKTAKVKITADTTVTVTFKQLKFPITFSALNGIGTIKAMRSNDKEITTGENIGYGYTIKFTAIPAEGYEVDKWSITPDYALIDGGTGVSKTAKVKITGNTTVKVSFKKKEYRVTFDAKGGLPVPTEQHVLYKEKASAPTVPAKEGYDLEGWFNKDGDALWDFAVNEVTKDTELYAKWKAKTDMAYTVQHLQQNISDDKYTVIDTENKTGTTDTMTVAAAKSYPGFTAQAVTQQTIKGDGTTIVQIKYDRNEITLTLDLNNLNSTNPHDIKKVKGRYGAPVTVAEPTCHGYKFIGWSPALPVTFPETDSSHTAQWKYVH